MLLVAVIPAVTCILVFIWLMIRKPASQLGAWRRVFNAFLVILIAVQIGPWVLTSHYFRYLALGLFILFALFQFYRARGTPFLQSAPMLVISRHLLVVLTLVFINLFIGVGRYYPSESMNLAIPFKQGEYLVLQGGSNLLTNPLHYFAGNRYALDIVKIDQYGLRAKKHLPKNLSDYYSYATPVHSVCDGKVLKSQDGEPDNTPGQSSSKAHDTKQSVAATTNDKPITKHRYGNHVIIQCQNHQLTFAHLQRGSVQVKPGQAVKSGAMIGRIGNSGYSSEPHLHLEASKRLTVGNQSSTVATGLKMNGRTYSINKTMTIDRN